MPRMLDNYSNLTPCDDPGTAMRAVAEKLAARGFAVRSPEWEESRSLTVTNAKHARSELTVEDDGSVRWDYRSRSGGSADPAELTGQVLRVLGTADTGEPQPTARPGISLKGVVGRALTARGLNVVLEVYEDPHFYDVGAEIVVTNPDRPERGLVRVSDEGDVTWECCYCHGGDAEEIADAVVDIFAADLGDCAKKQRRTRQFGRRAAARRDR